MPKVTDKANTRILFPVGRRESLATEKRLLKYPKRLAEYGYTVDILVNDDKTKEASTELYSNKKGINIIRAKNEERFWTMVQRDSFAKSFIKLYHDIVVPGTDFKFWKQVAFDDFLWHVSSHVYPRITEEYDLIIFPIPSFSEPPIASDDVFYSNVIFYAKENNVPIVGLQIYPIYDIPPIFTGIIDFFIVKEEYEKNYYKDLGISDEKIHIIEEISDNYCIATVEEPYKNLIFQGNISLAKDCLGIIIMNNSKNRTQIHAIIETLATLNIKKSVFFAFLNYTVKQLHENDVFDDLIAPVLRNKIGKYHRVEAGSTIKALMSCDVIIATSYVLPLSFAGEYGKTGIVYNPLKEEIPHIKDVTFTHTTDALAETVMKQYFKKQRTKNLADIVDDILK